MQALQHLVSSAQRCSWILACLVPLVACAGPPEALDPERPAVLLDRTGVALSGFDPVAYFETGQPVKGSPEFTAPWDGAVYRFASRAHRDLFLTDPERYAPAFGGWCAWAMAQDQGSLVEIDPRSFLIQDGRLLLFYDGLFADTRASWRKGDSQRLLQEATRNWKDKLSGR